MKLRIAEAAWAALAERLLARKDVETAGLLLGPCTMTPSGAVATIRNAFAIPDEAYRVRKMDQISIDPIALNRLTKLARDEGWSIFTIHTHPGATEAWFSSADDDGDARLMPSLHCQVPDAPHGSIVLVEGGATAARTFCADGAAQDVDFIVVGRTLDSRIAAKHRDEPWFARQELALGAHGHAQLRRLRVAVIGLGGIGSVVAMQAAHLGVGELVLVDGDTVEASNISRIIGAMRSDVGKSLKVDVAARYAKSIGLTHRIERVPEYLSPKLEPILASCDVVMSCVDRQAPRALLNRLAYLQLVPVIDLGVGFRVDEASRIVGEAGRVVVVGPGRPCLACWGHLDPHVLRREALSDEDQAKEITAGYIDGVEEVQPSVIAFNTCVAGAGVVELMRLATGFAGVDTPPLRVAFTFAEGTVRRNTVACNLRCNICGAVADGVSP